MRCSVLVLLVLAVLAVLVPQGPNLTSRERAMGSLLISGVKGHPLLFQVHEELGDVRHNRDFSLFASSLL
jgi:hypothetical protein